MKTSSENHSLVHTISQPYLWDASPDIPLHRHIVAIDKGNGQNGNGWENYSIGCKEILMYSSRKGNQIYINRIAKISWGSRTLVLIMITII
jgi:hypothetical protein